MVVVGCGALGTVIAEQLVRAGLGRLRIIDRDIVEWTNLQRQLLFDERDAAEAMPKAVAAATRLQQVNSEVLIEPRVADLHGGNIDELMGGDDAPDVVLDGTDNAETRYLVNDWAVKRGVPWVYGACVGVEGRVLGVRPGIGPCLRCIFPTPPGAGELPTCDTAGVLASAAGMVGSLQVVEAMRLLLEENGGADRLIAFDAWAGRFRTIDVSQGRRPDCPACAQKRFEFLLTRRADAAASLCGREAVQIRGDRLADFPATAARLTGVGTLQQTPYFLRCRLPEKITLTLFPDGRAIVQGTTDVGRARSIYARYVGG
jgi:adenylyltransferase/sulfurtransferase